MASDIKQKYPASNADTVALTITLASLASDAGLVIGRGSVAVDNRTNLDIDHLVSGKIRAGTSPTVSTQIEVWAYAPRNVASGTPVYPDTVTGTDAGVTLTSLNTKTAALRIVSIITIDNTSNRDYDIPPTSIAQLFGELPPFWGIWVAHNTAVALNSTGGNHEFNYHRIQKQST